MYQENIYKVDRNESLPFYLLKPQTAISKYVSMIWASDGKPNFQKELIIPDGASIVLFNFAEPLFSSDGKSNQVHFKKVIFTGVFSYFAYMHYPIGQYHKQIGIVFHAGGAKPFVKSDLSAFFNTAISENDGCIKHFYEWHEEMCSMQNINARMLFLEQQLNNYLKINVQHEMSIKLTELIKKTHQLNSTDIVRKTGYSHQYLNKILNKHVGVSLKTLQKIYRVQNAILLIKNKHDLSEVAFQCGYFDQAHFIHDFKETTSFTPRQFRLQQHTGNSRVLYL